jgi:hypothetical protein
MKKLLIILFLIVFPSIGICEWDKQETIKQLDNDIVNGYKYNVESEQSPILRYQNEIEEMKRKKEEKEIRRKILYPNTYWYHRKKIEKDNRKDD